MIDSMVRYDNQYGNPGSRGQGHVDSFADHYHASAKAEPGLDPFRPNNGGQVSAVLTRLHAVIVEDSRRRGGCQGKSEKIMGGRRERTANQTRTGTENPAGAGQARRRLPPG